jgi:hypothetical protein
LMQENSGDLSIIQTISIRKQDGELKFARASILLESSAC